MRLTIVLIVAILISCAGFTGCGMKPIQTPYRTTYSNAKNTRHYGTRGNWSTRRSYWGRHRVGHRAHGQRGRYRGV